MISISIDLRLINQSRCKKMQRKNGEAATFCDLIIIETPNGKYGDYMVKQEVSKEERQARVEMPILGNGKIVGKPRQQRPDDQPQQRRDDRPAPQRPARPLPTRPPRQTPPPDPALDPEEPDDIPF